MFVLVLISATPALAGPRLFVEVEATDGGPDPRTTRRLIALELDDLTIPGDPLIPGDSSEDVSLYYRIETDDGALRIALWDRGQSAGARRVSLGGHAALTARRVALAASELARVLARRRSIEAKFLAREAELAEATERQAALDAQRSRLGLVARGRADFLLDGAYLLGPSLGVQMNRDFPFRVELGMGFLAGRITDLSPGVGWSMLEGRLTPAWVFPGTRLGDVVLGVPLSAGAARVGSSAFVDGQPDQKSTWLARAGLDLRLQRRVAEHLRLDGGVGAGAMLRTLTIERGDDRVRLGGLWVGGSLGILID